MKPEHKEHSLRWIKALAAGRVGNKPHSKSARRGKKGKGKT